MKAMLIGVALASLLTACGGESDKSRATSESTTTSAWAGTVPSNVSWLKVEKGQHAYMGSDGGNSTTATVCDTREDYSRALSIWSVGGDAGLPASCRHQPEGVKVEMLDSYYDTAYFPTLLLLVRAAHWQAWTQSFSVLPIAPPGADLSCGDVQLDTARTASSSVEIKQSVKVQILRSYPHDSNIANWSVKVLDGPHAGRMGYMLSDFSCAVDGTNESANHFAWKAE